jgi:hypothetical protein
LAPNYERAAKELETIEAGKDIKLAKVDAIAEQDLSLKYSIKGYPTLFVFRKGIHYEYKGGRSTDGNNNLIFSFFF